jgi:hypothetical protein
MLDSASDIAGKGRDPPPAARPNPNPGMAFVLGQFLQDCKHILAVFFKGPWISIYLIASYARTHTSTIKGRQLPAHHLLPTWS